MIRQAGFKDIDSILQLGIECHAKAATPATVSKQIARRVIAQFVQSPKYFAMVAENDDKVTGMLLGGIEPIWFSERQVQGSDLLFYCKTGEGRELIRTFVEWCKTRNAVQVVMAVSSGGPKAMNASQLFEAEGFDTVGGMHMLSNSEVRS